MSNIHYTLPVKKCKSECLLGIDNICSSNDAIVVMKKYVGYGEDENIKDEVVVEKIKSKLNCETEKCVLNHPLLATGQNLNIIKKSLQRFKPAGPANNTDLLSNHDIDNLIRRLTNIYPNHYHMNYQMIDFAGVDCVNGKCRMPPTELGLIDMVDDVIKKKYITFSVVMNTDVRTGGGIHWFSLFCDFRKIPYTIEYFNSSGLKPRVQIQEWLIKTERNIASKMPNVKPQIIILKGMVHQKDSDTECGLYSIYYIWNRLSDIPYNSFQMRRIPDADMITFRTMCFAQH